MSVVGHRGVEQLGDDVQGLDGRSPCAMVLCMPFAFKNSYFPVLTLLFPVQKKKEEIVKNTQKGVHQCLGSTANTGP